MRNKWLGMAPWNHKQDDVKGSGDVNSNHKSAKASHESEAVFPEELISANAAEGGGVNFQIEFLPMEEIYQAARIPSPRKGYSIGKVVDMLNSEHIRDLSREMKRAAVLMALNAAGVPLNDVLQDAKSRQAALDAYEAEQKKHLEAEWARKAEENAGIEAEMERVKAQFMARISRNLEAVEQEKAMFATWLTTKQQAAQVIAEAAELCVKSADSQLVADTSSEVSTVGVRAAAAGSVN
jgi:hypothetical protein